MFVRFKDILEGSNATSEQPACFERGQTQNFIQLLLEPCRNSMNMKTKSMLLHVVLILLMDTLLQAVHLAVFRISELIAGGTPFNICPRFGYGVGYRIAGS